MWIDMSNSGTHLYMRTLWEENTDDRVDMYTKGFSGRFGVGIRTGIGHTDNSSIRH